MDTKKEIEMMVDGEDVLVNRNQLEEFVVHTLGISKRHRSSFDCVYESGNEDDVFVSLKELETLLGKEEQKPLPLWEISLMAVLTVGLFTFFRNW